MPLGPTAFEFLREPPQMAVRVGAAAEFVESLPAKRAVCRVPPYEVGHGGGTSQEEAERQKDDG